MVEIIYLDNAATTKIDPDVLDAMMKFLTDEYGNAGTLYKLGQNARQAVADARQAVAKFVGADHSQQIIFTGSGTEANNTVLFSVAEYLRGTGKTHIVTTAIEHDSIQRSVSRIMKLGFEITVLFPDETGCIPVDKVRAAVTDRTGLVSVMYMNNETGAENDVEAIAKICNERGVLFHTDCVQAAGCCDLNVNKIGCDFLTISSHKIHGPKGVGAVYARNPDIMSPIIYGGSNQEFGIRGGTENVAGIVGFGRACELMTVQRHDIDIHCSTLKQLLWSKINENLDEIGLSGIAHINGPSVIKHGKTINIRFDNVDGGTLLLMLDHKGVCVAAGSACTSQEQEPSHVLMAMGLSTEDAYHSIRISFSKYNTEEEVCAAAKLIVDSVATLLQWRRI